MPMSVIIYFSGLYPWTSLMSHHCTANTKITTREDFSYVCTSTVLIPAGEEIVTNYVWVHHMFSRILSFLFVIGGFLRKSFCFLRKNNNLYWGVVFDHQLWIPNFCNNFFVYLLSEYFYQVKVLNQYHNTPKNANTTLYTRKKTHCNTLNWGNWNSEFVKLVQWAEKDNIDS